MTTQLPAHTRLSASGAKKFIHCSGSVALEAEGPFPEDVDDESEWSREGTAAHDLGYTCLRSGEEPWMRIGEKFNGIEVTDDMSVAVQTYTDYIRQLHADMPYLKGFAETRVDDPTFHPDFGGTSDYYAYSTKTPDEGNPWLVVVDYKHGVGVPVSVDHNEQGMYYAYGIIRKLTIPNKALVRIVIVQPRVPFGEPVQEWTTTAGEIREWALKTLLPAMKRVDSGDTSLVPGDWCQFCPRRLRCPMLNADLDELIAVADNVPGLSKSTKTVDMDNERMSRLLEKIPAVRFLLTALKRDGERRLLAGETIHGQKLVNELGDRVWKPEAKAQLEASFGLEAYTVPEIKSPAAIEKLPGGKDIVAKLAYKPQKGLTMAPATDKRQPQKPPTGETIFNVDKLTSDE